MFATAASLALVVLATLVPPSAAAPAATESPDDCGRSVVFAAGEEGYHTFRIPAVVRTPDALVAFAEGRVDSPADDGDIDLVGPRPLRGRAERGREPVPADELGGWC